MPFDGIVARAVTNELNEKIIPGKIAKIYQPTDTELVFTIRSHGQNHSLLLSIHPVYARLHLTGDSYNNPKEPPMFCMLLRKHLSGAVIDSITQYGMERIITFSVRSRNEIGDVTTKKLIIELMGKHSNVMLVNGEKGHILDSMKHISASQNRYRTILPGFDYKLPPNQNKLNPLEVDSDMFLRKMDFNAGKLGKQIVQTLTGMSPFIANEIVHQAKLGAIGIYKEKFESMQEMIRYNRFLPAIYRNGKEDFHVLPITHKDGEPESFSETNMMLDSFYSGKAERDRVKQQAKDLYQFIKNERDKNTRKLKKHEKTLKKAENAVQYQRLGELLTANMHQVKQGDAEVNVIDYYDPDQNEMTIELNPNKTPSENAQNFFKTYQKLKTSKEKVQKEMKKANKEITYLEQLLQQIDAAREADIGEIRDELREEGYLKRQKQRKNKKKAPKPSPEKFMASDGTVILVGKNNKQNEYLTMKLANRDDIWLHTKDIPGSHVIIRSKEPSDDTLLEAARLAAFFSKSHQSSSVPVDYTKVRHVRKPNGAKPGYVTYDNQKTLFVTPEIDTAEKLKDGRPL
ncbi:MAG TPA: NFACT RNA binding domain-containing protein [Lentibacillus sp.]|uniref:Rqc2 family fibronectin-binding protein n=1 Tax=Lentibacillus sp. TaxID=1925746 RepID=UPI002B4AF4E4|nr:NFACT RNA binding domain-containing protein [Lentibacillus sp.]HLR62177.1 NFACT RNA binding domain-containing protein [Lentibacillus sp.]